MKPPQGPVLDQRDSLVIDIPLHRDAFPRPRADHDYEPWIEDALGESPTLAWDRSRLPDSIDRLEPMTPRAR